MEELTLYNDISQKKLGYEGEQLTDSEALIRALDLLDFYAALRALNNDLIEEPSGIDWIEVKDIQ